MLIEGLHADCINGRSCVRIAIMAVRAKLDGSQGKTGTAFNLLSPFMESSFGKLHCSTTSLSYVNKSNVSGCSSSRGDAKFTEVFLLINITKMSVYRGWQVVF